jgi:hypothetical protein
VFGACYQLFARAGWLYFVREFAIRRTRHGGSKAPSSHRKEHAMSQLSVMELEGQLGDLLPAREALSRGGLVLAVGSNNLTFVHSKATAIQVLTACSSNGASSSVTVINGALNGNG